MSGTEPDSIEMRPLIISQCTLNMDGQEALLLETFAEPLVGTVGTWSPSVKADFTLLAASVAPPVGASEHSATEREERYSSEMRRRSRRIALDTDADLRVAYAAHGPELYRFALRSLGDAGLAEEAVQDTFVRAWRAADRYDPSRGSLRTWLFAICRNAVIDLHRARSVRPTTLGQEERAARGESTDPIEEKMVAWQIEEALRSLSEERRYAIVETYYKGRSYKELAAELGVPEATLRTRVFYAMKALRQALEETGWGP